MEDLTTDSGLAFALEGDPRIYNTTRQIARVPLDDYVLDNDEQMTLARLANDATMLTLDGAASNSPSSATPRNSSSSLIVHQVKPTSAHSAHNFSPGKNSKQYLSTSTSASASASYCNGCKMGIA